jgi:glycine dehydrogenase subunit 1
VEKILRVIGVGDISELFNDIPASIKLTREQWEKLEIGFGKPISEIEARRILHGKLSKNTTLKNTSIHGGRGLPPLRSTTS